MDASRTWHSLHLSPEGVCSLRVDEWLRRCLARPAFKTVREMAKSE